MDSSSLENASRLLVVSKSFMENAELGKMVQISYSKEKKKLLCFCPKIKCMDDRDQIPTQPP